MKQNLLITNTYNALSKELNAIHDTSSVSNRSGIKASKYNKEYLINRLNNIQRIYDVSKLKDRNRQISDLQNQLRQYGDELQQLIRKFSTVRNDNRVPESYKNALSTDIKNRREFIKTMADEIRKIDFHSYTPTHTNGSN